MLIQSQEVGTLSAAPPKFGKVGEWPPVATNYLPLRWELFDFESSDKAACGAYMTAALAKESGKFTDEYAASLERQVGILDSPVDVVARLGNRSSAHIGDMNLELRRLVYTARWVRRDPVSRLPPGSTHEMTHSLTTGLAVEHSRELARSLGIRIGTNSAGLQAQLSTQFEQRFGFKLDIKAEEQQNTRLTLTNDGKHYRLFALWHVDRLVTIDTFTITGPIYFDREVTPQWVNRYAVQFTTSSEPFVTSWPR